MVVLHFAATAPVNPPDATPVLSQAQLWAGLKRKVRHADEFVPPITSCVVEKEEGNVVHRRVVFNGTKEVTETCTELAPHKVEFLMEDGTEVENIIGSGPSGKPEELYLTYSFKWKYPEMEEGSEEAQKELERQQKVRLCQERKKGCMLTLVCRCLQVLLRLA